MQTTLLRIFGLSRPVEIIPNAMTIGALCFGLTSVRMAHSGDFLSAVKCLSASALLDALDGHAARALHASTKLGAELDSLCDLADFGVAPAFIIFFWGQVLMAQTGAPESALWFSCLFFASCCSLRLARFNTTMKAPMVKAMTPKKKPRPRESRPLPFFRNMSKRSLYFSGVPAPMGASMVITPMALSMSSWYPLGLTEGWQPSHAAITLIITGLLMVSTLPTFSSKMFMSSKDSSHFRSHSILRLALKIVGGVLLLYFGYYYPMDVFITLNLGYVMSLPLGIASYYAFAK